MESQLFKTISTEQRQFVLEALRVARSAESIVSVIPWTESLSSGIIDGFGEEGDITGYWGYHTISGPPGSTVVLTVYDVEGIATEQFFTPSANNSCMTIFGFFHSVALSPDGMDAYPKWSFCGWKTSSQKWVPPTTNSQVSFNIDGAAFQAANNLQASNPIANVFTSAINYPDVANTDTVTFRLPKFDAMTFVESYLISDFGFSAFSVDSTTDLGIEWEVVITYTMSSLECVISAAVLGRPLTNSGAGESGAAACADFPHTYYINPQYLDIEPGITVYNDAALTSIVSATETFILRNADQRIFVLAGGVVGVDTGVNC